MTKQRTFTFFLNLKEIEIIEKIECTMHATSISNGNSIPAKSLIIRQEIIGNHCLQ